MTEAQIVVIRNTIRAALEQLTGSELRQLVMEPYQQLREDEALRSAA